MVIKIIILIGFQASSKSTIANKSPINTIILSRNIKAGAIINLLPKIETHIKNKKIIILDNTHLTKETRAPFINFAKKILFQYMLYIDTTIEDCQIKNN
jgi:predicted kinase